MSDWKNVTDEKVSREHRDKVMRAADSLLNDNALSNPGRRWVWSGLGLALTGFAAAFVLFKNRDPLELDGALKEDVATAIADPEMLDEADLLMDLELLEELEELEAWEET